MMKRFLFWNARNDYTKPFAAMPAMKGSKELYFRGDELMEAKQKPLAKSPCIVGCFETRSKTRPIRMTEIGVRGAGRDDQIVVG